MKKSRAYTIDEELATYRRALQIDKNDLDNIVAEHPQLLEKISDAYAMAQSKKDQSKTELDNVKAQLFLKYRRRANKAGDKTTNDEINSRIFSDELFVETSLAYTLASSDAARWQAMKEAFISRGFMIRELCSLYASNYFTTTAVKAGGREQKTVRSGRNASRAIDFTRS